MLNVKIKFGNSFINRTRHRWTIQTSSSVGKNKQFDPSKSEAVSVRHLVFDIKYFGDKKLTGI